MRRSYLLFGILTWMLLWACNRDEDKIQVGEVIDWFAVKDKPGELGHLLYDIYERTGLPVFVNDTLGGAYAGEDSKGNPVYNYETVSIKYYIYGAYDGVRFVLSRDTAAMLKAAETIDRWVLPNLAPEGIDRVKSFLLVDSLIWSAYGGERTRSKNAWVYNLSVETTPVGKLSDIKEMSDRELKFWAGMVISTKVQSWLDKYCSDSLSVFYKITNADVPSKQTFYLKEYNYWIDAKTGKFIDSQKFIGKTWSCYKQGFLEWAGIEQFGEPEWDEDYVDDSCEGWIQQVFRMVPTQACDVMNYIAAVYAYSDSEFETMFNGVEGKEKCVKKRLYMKTLVKLFEDAQGITRHPFE